MAGHARHCGGCNGYLASWDNCEGMGGNELTGILEAKLMEYAGGRSMTAGELRVIEAFRDTMAAGGAKPGLRWREQMAGFVIEWYCEPPKPNGRYRVHPGGDEWVTENGQPVRRVYEIEEIHGAASSPGEPDSDGRAGPGSGTPGPGQEAPAAAPQGG